MLLRRTTQNTCTEYCILRPTSKVAKLYFTTQMCLSVPQPNPTPPNTSAALACSSGLGISCQLKAASRETGTGRVPFT